MCCLCWRASDHPLPSLAQHDRRPSFVSTVYYLYIPLHKTSIIQYTHYIAIQTYFYNFLVEKRDIIFGGMSPNVMLRLAEPALIKYSHGKVCDIAKEGLRQAVQVRKVRGCIIDSIQPWPSSIYYIQTDPLSSQPHPSTHFHPYTHRLFYISTVLFFSLR